MFPIRTLLYTLPVAALVGLGGGLIVSDQFLTKYVATAQMEPFIPKSIRLDTALFRRTQPLVTNAHEFRTFLASTNIAPPSRATERVEQRLVGGETRFVRVEYNFGISKSDLRDMPESVAREYGVQVVKEGIGSGPIVFAMDKRQPVANEMAALISKNYSDTTLRLQLQDLIKYWAVDISSEITAVQQDTLNLKASLESLNTRLGSMKMLRESIRTQPNAGASGLDSGTQVQVSGARFLSISQQTLALESEKIDSEENLRQLQNNLSRASFKKRMGEVLQTILQKHRGSSVDALRALLSSYREEAKKLETEIGANDLNLQRVLNEFELSFTHLQNRYFNQPPEDVLVRREGPTTLGAALVGALAGMALFMVLFVLWHRFAGLRESFMQQTGRA